MKDPFARDDEDTAAKEADQQAGEELKNAAQEESLVQVEVPDEEQEDRDETQETTPKRDDRWRRHTRERDEARARAEAAEELSRRQQEQINQLLQHVTRPQAPVVQEKSREDEDLERSWSDLEESTRAFQTEWQAYARTGQEMPSERQKAYAVRRRELTDRYIDARAARARGVQQQQQITPEMVQRETQIAALRVRFPEVMGNQNAFMHANKMYEMEVAAGRAPGPKLADECMEKTKQRFRLSNGSARTPSDGERRKFMGTSASGGGRGSESSPTTVRLTKDQISIAHSAYPKMDPKKAEQRWVKDVFLPLQAKERGER